MKMGVTGLLRDPVSKKMKKKKIMPSSVLRAHMCVHTYTERENQRNHIHTKHKHIYIIHHFGLLAFYSEALT